MEGSKMKGNFTDFHQNIIEWAGLAPENAGLLGDEYERYMGGMTIISRMTPNRPTFADMVPG
jgi:hypothetical protein